MVVAGAGEGLDGVYTVDLLTPEANGYKHYSSRQGGHLFVGIKQGACTTWVHLGRLDFLATVY